MNYGPRRNYGSVVGGSRGSSGIRPNPGTVGSGRDNYRRRDLGANPNVNSGSMDRGARSGYTRDRVPGNNNGIRVNEGSRRTREVNNNDFNRTVQPGRDRNYQSDRPNMVAPRESTRPSRNYERSSSPAPSRSYSAPSPAPSRSNFNSGGGSRGGGFGGGSVGGGSRGGGGYRR